MGQFDDALIDVERVLREQPRDPWARVVRARVMIAQGKPEAALADADLALQLRPQLSTARHYRGMALVALARYGEAEREYRALLEADPGHAGVLVSLGSMLRLRGRLADSLKALDQAIASKPDYYLPYNERALTRHALKDLRGAAADMGRVCELRPRWATGWLNRGQLLLGARDYEGARAALSKVLGLPASPADQAKAYHYRGLARRLTGDVDGAIDDYGKALELDPRMVATSVNRADLLSRRGRDAEALREFRRAVRLAPTVWQAWVGLAQVLLKREEYSEAIEAIKRGQQTAPARVQGQLDSLLLQAQRGMSAK